MVTERRARFGLGRQLVRWIAAYAFVLHAILAGMVATQLAVSSAAPTFELCLTHPGGTPASAPDGLPAPAHQHDQCALHCAGVTGFAVLALALIAFVFPLRPIGYAPIRRAYPAPSFLCRAGLSRAPPLPA